MRNITTVIFTIISIMAFAQNGLIGESTILVNDNTAYGFSRPICGVNGSGKTVVMWGKKNNQNAYISIESDNGFSVPKQLNPNGMTVFSQDWVGPTMAIRDNNVHVAFKSQPENSGYVYVVSSSDGGITFGDTVRVSNNNWSRFPSIAVSPNGKNVYVAYMAFETGFLDPHYVLVTSTDGGKTFGKEVKASLAPGEVCDCCPADVIATDKEVFVSFRNNNSDLRDVWASVSKDFGATFSSVKDIDTTDWYIGGCPSSGPSMMIEDDLLLTTWMSDASVFIGSSSNSDLSNPKNFALWPRTNSLQNFPKIAGGNGNLVAVWQENANDTAMISMLYSNNGIEGLKSTELLRVDDETIGIPSNPFIHFDGAKFRVVYQNSQKRTIHLKTYIIEKSGINPPKSQSNIWINVDQNNDELHVFAPIQSHFSIYNNVGILISEGLCFKESMSIDIHEFAAGIYYLYVNNDSNSKVIKFSLAHDF